ncbi:hypothetical protein VULLAG_LOCUS3505 [Vulpes lagopus]
MVKWPSQAVILSLSECRAQDLQAWPYCMLGTALILLRPHPHCFPVGENRRNRRRTIAGAAPGTVGSWRNKGVEVLEASWGPPWASCLEDGDNAGGDAKVAGQPGRGSGGGV